MNIAIEIVDSPIEHGDFTSLFVIVDQRVIPEPSNHPQPIMSFGKHRGPARGYTIYQHLPVKVGRIIFSWENHNCLMGKSQFFMGESLFFMGKSPFKWETKTIYFHQPTNGKRTSSTRWCPRWESLSVGAQNNSNFTFGFYG